MFVKVTTSGSRQYLKLVEAYRDDSGVTRQKVVATLGRLDELQTGQTDALINGLLRTTGRPTLEQGVGDIEFSPALSLGDTWLLTALWNELGFSDAFRRVLRSKRQFDAEALLRVMVFNRLCDPKSKLGIMEWMSGVLIPGVDPEMVTHSHLLRTMDTLVDCADVLETTMASLFRPLIDKTLSVVFYDLTTISAMGSSEEDGELRQYGLSKNGGIERQVMLGVVQTAEGLPIHHEVFTGNTAETTTLIPTITTLIKRYPIERIVLVADRGLLSLDNLDALQSLQVGSRPLEFILAVPARRYGEFDHLLEAFHRDRCTQATEETVGELSWQGYRLVVSHNPDTAQEQSQRRNVRMAELEQDAQRWAGKLVGQESGKTYKGKKLSDAGVTARFYKAVGDAHLAHILKVDLTSKDFVYDLDERALQRAQMLDGKLLLVTNMPDYTPEEIVVRYKSLADIERGFRVLKSEIEIDPMFHRLPNRIRAHAMICFIALVLYRVLRMRLKAGNSPYSPGKVLEIMRKIQQHQVTLHRRKSSQGVSKLTPIQKELFEVIRLPKPPKTLL